MVMITIHLPSLKVQFNGNTDSTLENITSTLSTAYKHYQHRLPISGIQNRFSLFVVAAINCPLRDLAVPTNAPTRQFTVPRKAWNDRVSQPSALE
jgi:hypothetical protein